MTRDWCRCGKRAKLEEIKHPYPPMGAFRLFARGGTTNAPEYRVADAGAHAGHVLARHVHALNHARDGPLTVEWKDRLP